MDGGRGSRVGRALPVGKQRLPLQLVAGMCNPFCAESCVSVAQQATDRPRSCTKVAPKLHIRCIGRLLTCLPMIPSEHRPIDSARARLYGAARVARPSSGRCRSRDEGLLDTLEERASHSQATQAWASNRSGRPQSGGCIPPRRLPLTGSERVRPGTWCDITRQIRFARASVHPLDRRAKAPAGRVGGHGRAGSVRRAPAMWSCPMLYESSSPSAASARSGHPSVRDRAGAQDQGR